MRVNVSIFGKPMGVLSDEINERIYFQFLPEYLANCENPSPFALSFNSNAQYEKSRIFSGLFGVFADSLPDAWGNILINEHYRKLGRNPETITPLERLCAVGRKSWGAITYKPEIETLSEDNLELINLAEQSQMAKRILEGKAVEILPELIESGSPIGGARPKRNIYLDDTDSDKIFTTHADKPSRYAWILKLEIKPEKAYGVIEKAYYELAKVAGINVPQTRLLTDNLGNRHFAIKRFDWSHSDELRTLHCHTLAGMLTRDFDMGDTDYKDFFEALIRLTGDNSQLEEAFRRALFNVFYSVHDDHVKNHAFTMTENGEWKLSPAYDVMFSRPNPGNMFFRQMTFGGKRKDIGIEDIYTLGKSVGLKKHRISAIVEQVLSANNQWNSICDELSLPQQRRSEITSFWEMPTA